jgi:hypothetical protein
MLYQLSYVRAARDFSGPESRRSGRRLLNESIGAGP